MYLSAEGMEKLDGPSKGIVDMPTWLIEVLTERTLKAVEKKKKEGGQEGDSDVPDTGAPKVDSIHLFSFLTNS